MIQMTRAGYEAQYGTPPPASTPTKMTQAQYDAKYPSAPTAPTPYGESSSASMAANAIVNAGIGAGKQVASLPFNLANIGKNIANAASKIPGLGWLGTKTGSPSDVSTQVPQVLKPVGTAQAVGSGIADVAEFFIPGGAEKGVTTALDKAVDTAKFAEKFGTKAGDALSGILKVLGKGGTTAASMAGVAGVQTGGNVGAMKTAATIGGIAGAGGKLLELVGPDIAKALAKSNFRMSPAVEARVGAKADQAASFISSNGITGSPAKQFTKLVDVNQKFEDTMQASVGNTLQTSKVSLLKNIESIPEQFKDDPAIYKSVVKDVEDAKSVLRQTQGNQIGLNTLLKGKRSYGKAAFGKATAQVKGSIVASEGDYALEQAYEKTLEESMSKSGATINLPPDMQGYFGGKTSVTLPEFNKTYSAAINAKKFTNIAQFKSDTGLVGRLFGLWAGKMVGETIVPGLGGEIAGGAIGEMVASRGPAAVKSMIGNVARVGGATTVPMAKIGTGILNATNP